ncbi:hypothetical protein ACA910_007652 [Epithemia clementina (nom. ined.)]
MDIVCHPRRTVEIYPLSEERIGTTLELLQLLGGDVVVSRHQQNSFDVVARNTIQPFGSLLVIVRRQHHCASFFHHRTPHY